jgi:cystathionine gamma-synthase
VSARDDGAHRGAAPETLAAQALGHVDARTGALVPAIHPSTTFERDADGGYSTGRGYIRPHNPTCDEPAQLLAALEGGADCLLFASGMAAATAVFQSLLPGDHVLVCRVMYWALRKWLIDFAMPWGLQVEFVDASDAAAVAAAVRPGRTRLIWIETPANPTWEVTDIGAIAAIARGAGARLAVDATVATPVLTRPLALGADLVVHSATKYLNGHSDVLAGAVVCRAQDAFWQRLRAWHRDGGAVLGSFEAWLLLRGMRTLYVRVRHASASALAIARRLNGHPALHEVLYPGLQSHPGHAIARRQMDGGFGGMLSIRVVGGEAAAMAVAARVAVFKRATSLGGVESLIEHRASIEGPATPVPADLLRLSIGLEAIEDLTADLEQALAPAVPQHGTHVSGELPAQTAAPLQAPTSPPAPDDGVRDAIARVLREQVAPVVLERGGSIRIAGFEHGVLSLALEGSPAAAVPILDALQAQFRHHVPQVMQLRLVGAGEPAAGAGPGAAGDPASRIQALLDARINPALAAHGGHAILDAVHDGTVSLRFEGGCQGCAMAEVTLRQGIEPMIRECEPHTVAVRDVTDHPAGTAPYFKTRKG